MNTTPIAHITVFNSVRNKSNGKNIGRSDKRLTLQFNESAKQLIGMKEIVFNGRKMEISRPGIDSMQTYAIPSGHCNLRIQHEDLVGTYEVVKENDDLLKLIKTEI